MFNTVTYYYVLFKIVSLTPKSISMKGMSRTVRVLFQVGMD